jgi:hypothetical protein
MSTRSSCRPNYWTGRRELVPKASSLDGVFFRKSRVAVGDRTLGGRAKLRHFQDGRAIRAATLEFGDQLLPHHIGTEAGAIGLSDECDLISRDARASHADHIDAIEGVSTRHDAERRDVDRAAGVAGDETQTTKSIELMDGGIAAHDRVVEYLGVTRQQRRVCENHVVADPRIMPDMAGDHHVDAVAHDRRILRFARGMDGGGLTKDRSTADSYARRGITEFELEILGRKAHAREGIERTVLSDLYRARHLNGSDELRTRTDADSSSENTTGADFDAVSDFTFRIHDSRGVDEVCHGRFYARNPFVPYHRIWPRAEN